jgi:hypothetical protein
MRPPLRLLALIALPALMACPAQAQPAFRVKDVRPGNADSNPHGFTRVGNTAGNLRVYPAGAPLPNASVVNVAAGRTRANNAVASLGVGGAITVQYDVVPGTTAATHFLFDVFGYFE